MLKWNLRIQNGQNIRFEATQLACDPNSSTGTLSNQWNIAVTEDGEFRLGLGTQVVQANKGLVISADGNTLSFNGTVIAGTGASNGGDSSVLYSQGKAVQWGINSSQSGGLYASGQNLYWNARTDIRLTHQITKYGISINHQRITLTTSI
ncbi:MAG: hypothetical protein EZS28_050749, partial [Streblomastix strix]